MDKCSLFVSSCNVTEHREKQSFCCLKKSVCLYHTHPWRMGGSVWPLAHFPMGRGAEANEWEDMDISVCSQQGKQHTHSFTPPTERTLWSKVLKIKPHTHTHTNIPYLCTRFNFSSLQSLCMFSLTGWPFHSLSVPLTEKTPPVMSADKPHSASLGQDAAPQH